MRDRIRSTMSVSDSRFPDGMLFERPRGVSAVRVLGGFARVEVAGAGDAGARIEALTAISDAGVSLDFLQLTPEGFACLVREDLAPALGAALEGREARIEMGRSVVVVEAPNVRDEEGLVAGILAQAVESGARIEQIGDMHDRVLIACPDADSRRVAESLKERLMAGRA